MGSETAYGFQQIDHRSFPVVRDVFKHRLSGVGERNPTLGKGPDTECTMLLIIPRIPPPPPPLSPVIVALNTPASLFVLIANSLSLLCLSLFFSLSL